MSWLFDLRRFVAIITRSKAALREAFLELAEGEVSYGMQINEKKTKYMVTIRRARFFREVIADSAGLRALTNLTNKREKVE